MPDFKIVKFLNGEKNVYYNDVLLYFCFPCAPKTLYLVETTFQSLASWKLSIVENWT